MYGFRLFLILVILPSLAFATLNIFNFGMRCFRCRGLFSECISYSHVCDGDFDCPNGDDEQNCPFICPYPSFYRCSDNGICIRAEQLCNGIPECMNGEDESYDYCGRNPYGGRPYGYMDGYRAARSLFAINATEDALKK